ncbi:hypothetical protein FZEAL_2510 [Fusarium zealandicum]|uniref:Uncharacterized protein n=1 Tax=Fusarium zealandicum TaxID=1053134 RepID=A0A8H4XMN3_9HYPO|nr:hypothetical protein FZEAL_2510 [Fusarium zealandicum]
MDSQDYADPDIFQPFLPALGQHMRPIDLVRSNVPSYGVAVEVTYNMGLRDAQPGRTLRESLDVTQVDKIRFLQSLIAEKWLPQEVVSLGQWLDHWNHTVCWRPDPDSNQPLPDGYGTPVFLWSTPLDRMALRKDPVVKAFARKADTIGLVVGTGQANPMDGLGIMTARDNMSHGRSGGTQNALGTPYLAHNVFGNGGDTDSEAEDDHSGFLLSTLDFDGRGIVRDLVAAGAEPKEFWLIFLERHVNVAPPDNVQFGPSLKVMRDTWENETFANLATELKTLAPCTIHLLVPPKETASYVGENSPGKELANLSGKKVVVQQKNLNPMTNLAQIDCICTFFPSLAASRDSE